MKTLKTINIKTLILIALCSFLSAQVWAQVSAPAPPQNQPIALKGATAHIGNGQVVDNSLILFNEGKIVSVGSASDEVPSGYEVIDVSGKHAYPGLILPASDLGLAEISAVRATVDRGEQGQLNPNVRSIIAYNTDSEVTPTLRFNGILTAQVAPVGGLISGSSSIVQLDAWNWEDAALHTDDGIFLNWPRKTLGPRWWLGETETRENENYKPGIQQITQLMQQAQMYKGEDNLKLAAMQGLFDGSQTLYIRVSQAEGILQSAQLALNLGVKRMVIVGGFEALMVKDFLKENDIPVVLGQVHRMPAHNHDDVFASYRYPFMMQEAGLKVSIGYVGRTSSARNLAFSAGTAAAYGLDKEEALKMITLNTAEILGIDDHLGSLEGGKDATLVISSGDLLDMRTNNIEMAYIQGRKVTTDNKQQRLYRKFKDKYENSGD